jgi:hypothetical protein
VEWGRDEARGFGAGCTEEGRDEARGLYEVAMGGSSRAGCGGDNFLGSEQFRTFSTSKSTNTNKQPPSSRKNELSFE